MMTKVVSMKHIIASLVLVTIYTTGVVNGTDIETCTSEYCVCIGECPASYADVFDSSSSIFNGSDFVCYATKSMKFGIGGDEIRIGENIVFPSDLKPCSEDTSNFSIKAAAIIEDNMNSAAITVSSLSSLLTLSVVISIGLFGSIIA
mmetsp:Transcript_58452/g.65385  ORF Transcript_58452/g.65385 Transcript_58452/m.65385 type:complete len:147 (-) Transcript_58452:2425-2865(-)